MNRIEITIACPDTMIADANHLAMVLGEGPADGLTFPDPDWHGPGGHYAVAAVEVTDEWLHRARSVPERPAWDGVRPFAVDLAAARRAQAAIRLLQPGERRAAAPGEITILAGPKAVEAVALLGLQRLVDDEA